MDTLRSGVGMIGRWGRQAIDAIQQNEFGKQAIQGIGNAIKTGAEVIGKEGINAVADVISGGVTNPNAWLKAGGRLWESAQSAGRQTLNESTNAALQGVGGFIRSKGETFAPIADAVTGLQKPTIEMARDGRSFKPSTAGFDPTTYMPSTLDIRPKPIDRPILTAVKPKKDAIVTNVLTKQNPLGDLGGKIKTISKPTYLTVSGTNYSGTGPFHLP